MIQNVFKFSNSFSLRNFVTSIKSATQHLKINQPRPETHPHLIKKGELTPGITFDEYQQRRKKLMENIPSDSNHQQKILRFQQASNFFYYTGISTPDSICTFEKEKNNKFKYSIFSEQKGKEYELWWGKQTQKEDLKKIFGVDEIFQIEDFQNFLKKKLEKYNQFFVISEDEHISFRITISQIITQIKKSQEVKLFNAVGFGENQRKVKSKAELELLRKSALIGSYALKKVISKTKPGMIENQLAAEFEYHCKMQGAEFLSFPCIVASGINGTIIHYLHNNQVLEENDLILMDCGCELYGYSSDISRTFPANGKFTNAQKKLYDSVLKEQENLIQMCQTGVTIENLHLEAERGLARALINLGILKPPSLQVPLSRDLVHRFFPHSVSHLLGVDVHDCENLPKNQPLQNGTVLTIEPGLYIPNDPDIPLEFRGLGIRIEDDVVIHGDSPEVLTDSVPKKTQEIESLMNKEEKK
ncbi:xaa-pro aminopeptidase 3 [Anaeramoeba ignava]|uniref:Xaa-pro aminopeptidase 3 n=1 Tax=Anaeramoeba ignava TaxID=1746090 RepID=A0A9Q0L8D4_ANAIG|nr:xaa-pro aminopeptidase 3 [Anaeramoeba ignava]